MKRITEIEMPHGTRVLMTGEPCLDKFMSNTMSAGKLVLLGSTKGHEAAALDMMRVMVETQLSAGCVVCYYGTPDHLAGYSNVVNHDSFEAHDAEQRTSADVVKHARTMKEKHGRVDLILIDEMRGFERIHEEDPDYEGLCWRGLEEGRDLTSLARELECLIVGRVGFDERFDSSGVFNVTVAHHHASERLDGLVFKAVCFGPSGKGVHLADEQARVSLRLMATDYNFKRGTKVFDWDRESRRFSDIT